MENKTSWKIRRRVINATLIYCAVSVAYVLEKTSPSSVHETLAVVLIGLAMSVIGSYVFGAVWDDKGK